MSGKLNLFSVSCYVGCIGGWFWHHYMLNAIGIKLTYVNMIIGVSCFWTWFLFGQIIYRGEFSLTNFEDGVLSSSFMVGLLVACPIFATLAER